MTLAFDDLLRLPDFDDVRRYIPKYDQPGPRYTSYPTAPVWTEDFDESEFREALARARNRKLSLYIHIPFCERLCSFCACNKTITQDHAVGGPYLDGLEREAEMLASAIGGERRCVQLAVGGGTPTFLSPQELARMCRVVDSHFPPDANAERSVEVDPRVTSRAQLEVLSEHGFNRISLGVQDFAPRVQRAINRVQSREQTERITLDARALGYASVNFDLIYGLPFQTVASFGETLDQVIALRPDRIALYSYAHVTWIVKAQRGFEKKDLPSAERKLAIMLLASQRLGEAGYRFLGLDHFALPQDELCVAAASGDLRRNFNGYTIRAGVDLIALGPTDISTALGMTDPADPRLKQTFEDLAAKVKAVGKAKVYIPVNHAACRFTPQDLLGMGVSYTSVAPAPPTIVLNALKASAQNIREETAKAVTV